jgi:hypothetical protein
MPKKPRFQAALLVATRAIAVGVCVVAGLFAVIPASSAYAGGTVTNYTGTGLSAPFGVTAGPQHARLRP